MSHTIPHHFAASQRKNGKDSWPGASDSCTTTSGTGATHHIILGWWPWTWGGRKDVGSDGGEGPTKKLGRHAIPTLHIRTLT